LNRRYWNFARPYLPIYAAGLLLLLATNALGLWIPWLLRDAIDALERGVGLGVVAGFAAWISGVALLQAVVRSLSRQAILGNSRRIVYDIRNAFFAQLLRLGASYYDTHRTGDIMSRGVNDIQLIQSFFGPGVLNLLNTTIVYTATIVLLLSIDATLTLIALVVFPFLFLGVNRLSRRVYARSIAVQEQLAAISNRSQENISGIQQVKTYVQEDREIERFRRLCAELRRRNLAMAVVRGGMVSLIGVVTGVGTLIVLFVGGRFVIEGRISFGDFVAFNAYLGLLGWPTIALGWIINTFQRGAGAMQRLDEVFRNQPDIPAAADTTTEARAAATPESPLDGDIEIRDLTFVYEGQGADGADPGSRVPALHDINLHIPRGSRVALVGPVGSGKSTLASLLARVYPVPGGTIRIGGTDINEIPVSRLRRNIGYVPQEAFLFSRSIRENVSFGQPEASDAQVFEAHKRQPSIEKRFEQTKTVFEIAPVLLKNEGRIEALFFVYFLALLVQAIIERELRRAMLRDGVDTLALYPEERDTRRPTAEQVFRLFSLTQRHTLEHDGQQVRSFEPELTDLQHQVLHLLGMPRNLYRTPH